MRAIVADINVQGHVAVLVQILQGSEWAGVWAELDAAILSLDDLGLPQDTRDSVLWNTCQRDELVLVTGNRNAQGPDSLEATIRQYSQSHHLPVLTLATPTRILQDRAYAERAAFRLLAYVLDIDNYRGAGRLYVP